MALQSIKGGTWLPNRPPQLDAALSLVGLKIDSPGEKVAFIVQASKAGTINSISFNIQSLVSSGQIAVRLETVDATGMPSGTPWGTTGTITQNVTNVGWKTYTLSPAAMNVPRGQYLAIVIAVHTLSSADVNVATIDPACCRQEFPYTAHYAYPGPAWSKLSNCPVCALEYSDGSYEVIQGAWPVKAVDNTSFNNTGTNQRGLRVKLPFPAQAVGAWVWADLDGDAALKLYNNVTPSSPAELASVTLDKDYRYGTTYGRQVYYFNTSVVLNQDAEYFLTLNPSSATSVILNEVEVNAAALLDGMDGG